MEHIQKRLCIFVHYSTSATLPLYVKIYIDEISNHFDEMILVTNQRSVDFSGLFVQKNLTTLFVKNEGYDLGMFYKAIQTIRIDEYRQIGCINDSNILFNRLDPIFKWSVSQQADFWGLIDSNQKPWFSTHSNNYHLQSHFLVFNQKAISKLPAFFNSIDIPKIFKESDLKKVRQMVIDKWEIGLTQFMHNSGLKSASYIDSHAFSINYLAGKHTNVGLKLYPELIRSGYPLLKMKVITKGKWKDIFRTKSYWSKLIRKYGHPDWEIESLIKELQQIKKESGNQPLMKLQRMIKKGII